MSKGRLNEDDLLDTIAKSNEVSSSDKVLYLVNGVLVSLCPIYIYTAIFNLSFRDTWPVFLLVSIVCGGLLSKAYETVASSTHVALARTRRLGSDLDDHLNNNKQNKQKQARSAATTELRELTHQESLSFSVFYNNALFLALVILFAFYLFKNVSGVFNFVLSNGFAAAIVMLSSTQTNK